MNPRALFFDADTAESVRARLVLAGFRAEVVREALAGEDDDEDHPYAVLSDAPEYTLDLLVEEYDGWLEFPEETSSTPAPPPLVLPTAPKRIKRPENLA